MTAKEGLSEDDICRHIRDSVLEQRLTPGTKLTEEALCGVFKVGRNTIRRVFLLLSKDHIIELQKNKGAVVASPTPEEAKEVFEARAAIESILLEKAIERATKADIAVLKQHTLDEEQALKTANIAQWIRLTGEFHLKLADLGRNKPLYHALERLVFQTSLIIGLYGQRTSGPSCRGDDHEMLVDAIVNKDLSGAQKILSHHLSMIEGQLEFKKFSNTPDLTQIFATKLAS